VRILVLAAACLAVSSCNESLASRAKEGKTVPSEPRDVEFGAAALKALAQLSKEDRAEVMGSNARAAARHELGPFSIGFVILDGDLPSNAVALIVEDPNKQGARFVVFSNRNYNDAVFAMVSEALQAPEGVAAIARHGRVRVTSRATVVDNESNTLFELRPPPVELTHTSGTLLHLKEVAASVAPIEIANLGKGNLYRFF